MAGLRKGVMAGGKEEPKSDQKAILHLCNDFHTQPLYAHLINSLRDRGERQAVFVPVRKESALSLQPPDEEGAVSYRFCNVLRPFHRIFFRTKIRSMKDAVSRSTDLHQFGVSHAHTLYSMGALALSLKKEQGLPYIVAVRTTDLNFFMRYRPDLNSLAREILIESNRVIFLSPVFRTAFLRRLDDELRSQIERKAQVLPNGLDSFWISAPPGPHSSRSSDLRVLYVGEFSARKNVLGLIHAMALVSRNRPARLSLVGGGGGQSRRIMSAIEGAGGVRVEYLGRVEDRVKLQRIYRAHDMLVVPSFLETFGMVYAEALSQGLPVIHSRGQGIDGYFEPGTVTESVSPEDPNDIAAGIERLALRSDQVRHDCIAASARFHWRTIAPRYSEIYRESSR